MTRKVAGVAIASLITAAFVTALAAVPAGAAAPDEQGWWTAANPGVAATPAPPDVPANGLLVQGGGSGPTAYAALLYDLPAGTVARTLTLTIASNSATTPLATLTVCPLRQAALHAEQGGAIGDAPAYDCTAKATAGPASNGKGYAFNLSGLQLSGLIAVAIVPSAPTDRVVFDKPDAGSLATQVPDQPTGGGSSDTVTAPQSLPQAESTAPASASGGTTADIVPPAGAVTSDASSGTPTVTPASSIAPPTATDVGSAPPASTPAVAIAAPGAQLAVATGPGRSGATPAAAVIAIAAVVASAALWAFAGRSGSSAQP